MLLYLLHHSHYNIFRHLKMIKNIKKKHTIYYPISKTNGFKLHANVLIIFLQYFHISYFVF